MRIFFIEIRCIAWLDWAESGWPNRYLHAVVDLDDARSLLIAVSPPSFPARCQQFNRR